MMAKHRSQNAQLFSSVMTLCAWAASVPRQFIDIFCQIDLGSSYSSLRTEKAAVSDICIAGAQKMVHEPHGMNLDNMQTKSSQYVEQREGAPFRVLTGTMMIMLGLRNAPKASLSLAPIVQNQRKLPQISFKEHVRPSTATLSAIRRHKAIHIVEILYEWAPAFRPLSSDYTSSPILQHPAIRPPPKGYTTEQKPLRATTTSDKTIEDMIEIWREIYEDQLAVDAPKEIHTAIPTYNDQASNALIRSAKVRRKHDNSDFTSFRCQQLGPGMFHFDLNTVWNLLCVHRGHVDDVGSIESFITHNGKVRHGSEHPDYHALKATETQVLFGIMLHAWEKECGSSSLASFAASKPTPNALLKIAYTILDKYASTPGSDDYRTDINDPESEDVIRRNTQLLCRDLLLYWTMHKAIKSGDGGRTFQMFGEFAIWFAGAGARNYCAECLHFIFNQVMIWPPDFA